MAFDACHVGICNLAVGCAIVDKRTAKAERDYIKTERDYIKTERDYISTGLLLV